MITESLVVLHKTFKDCFSNIECAMVIYSMCSNIK